MEEQAFSLKKTLIRRDSCHRLKEERGHLGRDRPFISHLGGVTASHHTTGSMEPRGKASRGRQRVVVNTETHTGSSASGVLGSKQALIPQLPPPPLSQTSRKRWQKDCKSQRLGRNAMKQSILDMTWLRHPQTHSNCGEMHKSLTRSSQSIFQHGEGGTQSLTPS